MGRQVIAYSSTILIAALLLTGGCNREDLGPCEASVAPECDITDPACVAAHSDHVVCIRGIEASVPSLELVSPATAQSQLYGAPRPVTVNDRCLETLGLESFETQRSEPEVPGAIYSLTDRKVLVVDPHDSRAILRMIALAHVDEGVDFIDFVGDAETTDAQIARQARLLGEAFFIGDVAWWKIEPMSDGELQDMVEKNIYFGDEIADLLWLARERRAGLGPVVNQFGFYGAQYVLDHWLAGSFAAASPELGDLDSREIIIGLQSEPETVDFTEVPSLPGYTPTSRDSLGPLATHTHFTRADPPLDDTFAVDRERLVTLSGISRGDQVTCLYDPVNDATAALWEIVLDDVDALPYPLEYEELGTVKHTVRDDRVIVIAAEDLTARDQLFEAIM